MLGSLPATVDPVLLAEKSTRLVGRITLRGMTRLRALLADDLGEVEVDLSFERVEGSGLRRMCGRLAAAVNMTCQRCLEPMSIGLVAEPETILLRPGELEGKLPSEAEALTFGPVPVALAELIEDELLLVMPMVPMHPLNECPARRYVTVGVTRDTTENPFARLAQSKRNQD